MSKKLNKAEQDKAKMARLALRLNLLLCLLVKKSGGSLHFTKADMDLVSEGIAVDIEQSEDNSLTVLLDEPSPTVGGSFKWQLLGYGWAWAQGGKHLIGIGCRHVLSKLWRLPKANL